MYANSTSDTAAGTLQRQELAAQLTTHHDAFIEYINALTDEDFNRKVNGKWTAGQQLQHILLAVRPLNQALRLPAFLMRMLFGKANRTSKSYDGLVQKYRDKLQQGGRASERFVPKPVHRSERAALAAALRKAVRLLARQVSRFSEQQLDNMILPHPLLGKVTIREMIYFTIYHVQHHHEATRRNLE